MKSSAYEARSRDRYVNLNQRVDADGLQHALGLLDEGIHGEVEILEQIAGWRGFSEAIDSEHRMTSDSDYEVGSRSVKNFAIRCLASGAKPSFLNISNA